MYTDSHDFEELSMFPALLFFPDEFIREDVIPDDQFVQCDITYIHITDDNVNEAEQIFVVEISVDPDLQNQITTSVNVSLIHIIDNDGE